MEIFHILEKATFISHLLQIGFDPHYLMLLQSISKVLGTLAIFHEKSTYTIDMSIKFIFPLPASPINVGFPTSTA